MLTGHAARRRLIVAAILLLAVVGVAAWLWRSAGSSTPVSESAALAAFRHEGGAAPGPRAPGVPRPGVYTYRQAGGERGGVGPLSVSRGLPSEARYVVTLTPDGYAEELSLSEEHIEAVRYRMTPAGSRAVERRTDVTFLGVGRDDRRDLLPAPLHIPRDLAVGRRWSGRYAAGQLPVTYRSQVLRRDEVEVGGRRLPAVVVRTVADTGGVHPGTRTDTLWWSASLALPLRWDIDMGIRGVASLTTHARLGLEDPAPRT